MRQVSMDLASFELVRNCADALLGLLRERLLDLVFCNEQEAAALAEVLPVLPHVKACIAHPLRGQVLLYSILCTVSCSVSLTASEW